ncbi:nuclear transport factor 2 family protein [Streptomyces sparsogenes]|uniref:nuclear transport factor 2 family protein n=1 Tax=Streptomyces sparsogenes TaxID=67365 RepID=UPI003326B192
MTATSGTAQKIADEFLRAWLGRDVEKALSFLADDIVCEAPSGRFEGLDRYRQFLPAREVPDRRGARPGQRPRSVAVKLRP